MCTGRQTNPAQTGQPTGIPVGQQFGILTGKQIEKCGLIQNGSKECYQACSYDLRLGNEHYVSDENGKWKLVCLSSKDGGFKEFSQRNEAIDEGQLKYNDYDQIHYQRSNAGGDILRIPPFGTAIIELSEIIDTDTPLNASPAMVIVGRFDLKLSIIYKGLFSQQATQVEPGYVGHLYCFITSQSSENVDLKLGERVATLEFSFADNQDADKIKKKAAAKAKKKKSEFFKKGILDIRHFYTTGIPIDCGLTPIYNKVKSEYKKEVNAYLEKNETIDIISKNVERSLNTKNSLVKAFFTFSAAIVTGLGGNYVVRVGNKIEAIADALSTFLTQLQSNGDDSIDVNQISIELRALNAEGGFFRRVVWFVVGVCVFLGLRLLMNNYYVNKMHRKQSKDKYILYRDGDDDDD